MRRIWYQLLVDLASFSALADDELYSVVAVVACIHPDSVLESNDFDLESLHRRFSCGETFQVPPNRLGR